MCREISSDLLSSSLSILSSPARYDTMVDPPLPLSVIIIKSTSFAFIERFASAARSRRKSCRYKLLAQSTDNSKQADKNLRFG